MEGLGKIFGTVLHRDAPLDSVTVSIGKLQTLTNAQGYYEFLIPKDQQAPKKSVQFYKKGYKLQTQTAYPQTGEALKVVMQSL